MRGALVLCSASHLVDFFLVRWSTVVDERKVRASVELLLVRLIGLYRIKLSFHVELGLRSVCLPRSILILDRSVHDARWKVELLHQADNRLILELGITAGVCLRLQLFDLHHQHLLRQQ